MTRVTPDQAAARLCHKTLRTYWTATGEGTAGRFATTGTECIGPRCMAWRWDTWADGRGYCGLAGPPDGDGRRSR